MGVYHFMGVGRAVGAVTCAVDYIEKALNKILSNDDSPEVIKLFHSSGGISHNEIDRGKIEAIVLFTSKEVIENKIEAFPYTGCQKPGKMRDETLHNLKKVWNRSDPDEGRKIFWCEVDIDSYKDCFEKIVKVAYRFSPPGKQGKEIWCNLTGGTNSTGLALLTMARLTGLSTRHYLISQRREYQKEVKVPGHIKIIPNKDDYFNVVPFIKTYIDTINFYEILMELKSINKPETTTNLFYRLKGKSLFVTTTFDDFKKRYMLKLYGLGYTDYNQQADEVSLNINGRNFINEIEDLEAVIEIEEKLLQKKIDIIEESKKWKWFKQVDTL